MRTLIILALLLTGCAHQTVLTTPEGDVWSIEHGKDALVSFESPDGYKILSDNRGTPGFWEGFLQMWGVKEMNKEND